MGPKWVSASCGFSVPIIVFMSTESKCHRSLAVSASLFTEKGAWSVKNADFAKFP